MTGANLRRTLAAVLLAALLATALLVAGVEVVRVEGRSMAPTLRPGDLVIAARLPYLRHFIAPGDLVLATAPGRGGSHATLVIKRVGSIAQTADGETEVTLVGDNEDASRDSRVYGVVGGDQIVGLIVWTSRQRDRAAD